MKKYIFVLLPSLLIVAMSAATIIEAIADTQRATTAVYHSWWFIALWAITAIYGLYMVAKVANKKPEIILLHTAFAIILLGAMLTFSTAEQGTIHIRQSETSNTFINDEGQKVDLPFGITLDSFDIEYYKATRTPSNYISQLTIDNNIKGVISTNNTLSYKNYQLCQAEYDEDFKGTTLLIRHDAWGLTLTYIGYAMLLAGMVVFLFGKKSVFYSLLKSAAVATLLLNVGNIDAQQTISAEAAKHLGQLQMLHNGRVCPLQTYAIQLTSKLYSKPTYKDFSAEQIVAGYMFFPDQWDDVDIIRIKSATVRRLLNIDTEYASFSSFFDNDNNYKLSAAFAALRHGKMQKLRQPLSEANEKAQLIADLESGYSFAIFPDFSNNKNQWLSPLNTHESKLPDNEKNIIDKSIELMRIYAQNGQNDSLIHVIDKLKRYQQIRGGKMLPAQSKVNAELTYNKLMVNRPLAICLIVIGLIFVALCASKPQRTTHGLYWAIALTTAIIAALILSAIMSLRWFITEQVPLSGGAPTMQFLALCTLITAGIAGRRMIMILPLGIIFAGLALMVASFGDANPQITLLMPVLTSPLLSLHVALVMMAYTLFGYLAFSGIYAITIGSKMQERLAHTNRIVLYPAIFLLTAGIFVGAVWAQQSWGRYWAWDPKETWALITMLIYSLPLHTQTIPKLAKPRIFHIYMIIAFASILMTYFGVNNLLGGMHAYN